VSDVKSSDVEHLLRELAPQVLGAITRRHRDFADAEDAMQDALLAAATQWTAAGVPANPRGWLYHVALRRLADTSRSESARRQREQTYVREPSTADMASLDDSHDDLIVDNDDTLALLFMCSHSALSPASATALTLRAVGGLTTAEIARAFMVPEATMAQRISRAKQTIAASGAVFELPTPSERQARLGHVLQVLYLVFNEGYASTSGHAVVRSDLSGEAIRLTRALRVLLPHDHEVGGLLALMLLTDARREARTSPVGELIPLDEQDRSRWNAAMIAEGKNLVSVTLSGGEVGPYQVQAAIAALHDDAPRVEDTDWPQILALYQLLSRMTDNPMVRLSIAIAEGMVHGPREGLKRLDELANDARLAATHRLDGVRAHLLERAGECGEAIVCYRLAAERTTSIAERNYLLAKAARLSHDA
jgi:RNA polymerase sigma factor (sigma-70 family)